MKVEGVNDAYFVEVRELDGKIAVTTGNKLGQMMSVMLSKENWKKIKEEKK